MTPRNPRTLAERTRDTLARLTDDVDLWVATADPGGTPYLVPLSFLWDGTALLLATPEASPTGRNLAAGRARLALGPTRDVVVIEATVRTLARAAEVPVDVGDAFAAKTGFDPRELRTEYLFFTIAPQRVQAWREADELEGRELMRNGAWLVDSDGYRD